MATMLQMAARPVEEGWNCKRSGDCCRTVDIVVMHQLEKQALLSWCEANLPMAKYSGLSWGTVDHEFVSLSAGPCPFLDESGKFPACIVHDARPYNCRRFGCLRPDPSSEPLQMAPLSTVLRYGTIGCVNLRERLLQSRVARRTYELLQRKGMKWALKHGWKQSH